MFAPTFASFIAPAILPGLSPRHPSQVSPAAQERRPASNLPRLATVAGPMALSTTEFRDDTALSQRQLDLGSDHLALHLFTTRILATAQRMSATDGSVVVDLASSVATKYSVGLSIDVSFLSDLAGQIDRLAALDPTLPSWAPAARNLLPWPTL